MSKNNKLDDSTMIEVDGRSITAGMVRELGVKPDRIVRINKRLYMNGKCLNENGPEWGLYGIPVLPGPTVSDGISRPVLIIDDGLKLTEA
jgi:hypothetical protein